MSSRRRYSRDHEVVIEGKPAILGSSDPSFHGNPSRHNPEELLVAALSQCHMLWYVNLCHANGVPVLEYIDAATGTMEEDRQTGAGRFVEVTLRPRVRLVGDESKRPLAESLHREASEKCFIANSVNFPVHHAPQICFAPAPVAS